ncbi:hypothetical protein [Streptomyces sp. NRRL S-350]|uniref:hypothetical protein n=1 Tax=Streptomyces sp. NRRL S-350 TaxID=1463902 RepID=UPI00131A6A9F|nr:hypothetical protein [Streptomyces sp. NRRL S-350]
MAEFTPVATQENNQLEVHEVELTPEEWDAFRASPIKFLTDLAGSDGIKVNRLLLDSRMVETWIDNDGDSDGPPGICHGVLTRQHVITGPYKSTVGWHCSGHWE